MKKRLISLLLAVLMVATLFSGMTVSASADATVTTVTLQSGDTVLGLCKKLGVDYYTYKNLIMALNGFTSESQFSKLPVGGKVVLPVSAAAAASLAGSGTIPTGTGTTTGATGTVTGPATSAGTSMSLPAGDYVSYYLVNYTIKSGETIAGIYNNWGLSYKTYSAQILKLNKIASFNAIPAGKTLLLPTTSPALAGAAYYTVMAHTLKSGESAYNIVCTNYGLNFNSAQPMLQALNNRENLGNFFVGETLYIPVQGIVSANTTVTPGTGSTGSTTTTGTVTSGVNYNLVAQTPTNGSFIFEVGGKSATTAAAGKTVKVIASPNTGYAVESVRVVKVGDAATSIPVSGDYSFTMPSYSVTVSVTFRQASAYGISVDNSTNGSVAALVGNVRVDSAYTGSKVTVKTIPATGFMVDTVRVTYNNYRDTIAVENSVFTMPAFPVTVSATFKEDPNYDPAKGHNIYTDVANGKIETFVGDSAVSTAKVGERVTLKVTPYTNYTLESLRVYYDNFSKTVDVEKNAFTMPDSPVTIVATIKATSDATFDITKVSTTEGQFALTVGGKEVTSAKVGQQVTITANSNKEYYNFQAVVSKTGDSSVTVAVDENGVFTMPDYPVTVRIKFYQYHNIILDASNGTRGYFNVTTAFNGMAVNKCGAGVELKVTVWGYDQYLYTPGNVILTYADGSTYTVNGASFIMPDCDVKVRVNFNEVTRVAAYSITDPSGAGNSYSIGGHTIGDVGNSSTDIIVGLGSRVWIAPKCALGYSVKDVNCRYILGDGTEVSHSAIYDSDSGKYYFDMPTSLKSGTKAEVRVSFKEIANYSIFLDYANDPYGDNSDRKRGTFSTLTAMGGVSSAAEKSKVTILFQPTDGNKIDLARVAIYDENGNDVTSAVQFNRNDYSFYMPAYPVRIVAAFNSLDHNVYVSEIPLMADGTRPEGILGVQVNGGLKYTDSQLTIDRALPVVVREGSLLTVINQSRDGYILRNENPIVVTRVHGGADPVVTMIDDDRFSFQMPDDDVIITAYYQHDMYNIIAEEAAYGTYTVPKQAAWGNGEVVEITNILPNAGYEFDKAYIRYYDANGTIVTTELTGTTFSLSSKPASDVLVTVLFKAKANALDIEYYFLDVPNTSNRYKVNLYVNGKSVEMLRSETLTAATGFQSGYTDKVDLTKGGIPTGSTVIISRDETAGVHDQNFRIANIVVTLNSTPVPVIIANGQYSFVMPSVTNSDKLLVQVTFEKLTSDKFSLVAVNTDVGEAKAEFSIGGNPAEKAGLGETIDFVITPSTGSVIGSTAPYLEFVDFDGKQHPANDGTDPVVTFDPATGKGSFTAPSALPQTGVTLKYAVEPATFNVKIVGSINGSDFNDSRFAATPNPSKWGSSNVVSLTPPVDAGYAIEKVTISYTDCAGAVVSEQPIGVAADGSYQFAVPTATTSDVTVRIYYIEATHKINFINNETGWGTTTALVNGSTVYEGGVIADGSTVEIFQAAEAGYQPFAYEVRRADDGSVIATNSSFTMPNCDVVVVSTFIKVSYVLVPMRYVADGSLELIDSLGNGRVRLAVNNDYTDTTAGVGDSVKIDPLPGYMVERLRINYYDASDVLIANREIAGNVFTVESIPSATNPNLYIEALVRATDGHRYSIAAVAQGNSTGAQSVEFTSANAGTGPAVSPLYNKDVTATIVMVPGYTLDPSSVKLSYTDYQGNVQELAVPAGDVVVIATDVYSITLTNAHFTKGTEFLPPQVNSSVSLIYTVN